MIYNARRIRYATFLILLFGTSCSSNNDHTGRPYSDSQYSGGAQEIPGRLQCEYFDTGGEGIAFHDQDSVNSGSGALNPADGTYLNEFRINEAVDISYTKFREPLIDNSPFNFVDPEKDQLYVGWTAPGEWIKYTVDVKETGSYKLGLMYTANQDGQISLSVNDNDITGPINISSTYIADDTIAWRQWHHWNYVDGIAEIQLNKGIQSITFHTVAVGQMNYEYIDFKLISTGN